MSLQSVAFVKLILSIFFLSLFLGITIETITFFFPSFKCHVPVTSGLQAWHVFVGSIVCSLILKLSMLKSFQRGSVILGKCFIVFKIAKHLALEVVMVIFTAFCKNNSSPALFIIIIISLTHFQPHFSHPIPLTHSTCPHTLHLFSVGFWFCT